MTYQYLSRSMGNFPVLFKAASKQLSTVKYFSSLLQDSSPLSSTFQGYFKTALHCQVLFKAASRQLSTVKYFQGYFKTALHCQVLFKATSRQLSTVKHFSSLLQNSSPLSSTFQGCFKTALHCKVLFQGYSKTALHCQVLFKPTSRQLSTIKYFSRLLQDSSPLSSTFQACFKTALHC